MADESQNIVEIDGLTKDYQTGFWKKRSVRALDGLTLSVRPGGIFGFLGGNGAGKTTTIKILMGLLFPTAGTAKILGTNIDDVEMRKRIGYCPESPYFYDYLTANELMDYFGQIFGMDAAKRRSRTDELLTAVGIAENDRNKQLRKFSKGMLQRVGLAQALINDPELVFLDEPMSGLDPIGRREIRELIESLRTDGKTVFMSTHILSDVEALCDEVAILNRGKLTAAGKLNDLLADHSRERSFEITLSNADVDALRAELTKISVTNVASKPNAVSVIVNNESAIEEVLRLAHKMNARLNSVQPARQSLEDLFVQSTD